MQLLLNLLKNSLEAIIEELLCNDQLKGKVQLDALAYQDTATIGDIFQSRHTTKQRGSGYGLHSAVTFVQSLGERFRQTANGSIKGNIKGSIKG